MSVDDTPGTTLNWFKTNYRMDYDLQSEIAKRAGQIFNQIPIQPSQRVNASFFMGAGNDPNDPSRLTLVMNEYGVIFLGVMAKAILDSLSGEFQALLSSEIGKSAVKKWIEEEIAQIINKCTYCKNVNRPSAKYCDGCGKELKKSSAESGAGNKNLQK